MVIVIDGNRRLDNVELHPDLAPGKGMTVGEWVDEVVARYPVSADAAGIGRPVTLALAGVALDRDRKVASLSDGALLEVVAP